MLITMKNIASSFFSYGSSIHQDDKSEPTVLNAKTYWVIMVDLRGSHPRRSGVSGNHLESSSLG